MPAQRTLKDEQGQHYTLGKLLGSGGQAEVYAISGHGKLAAKVYRKSPHTSHRPKIVWMMDHPPLSANHAPGASITWPSGFLLNDQDELAGILLPRVRDSLILTSAYNPLLRAQKHPNWNRERLLKVAWRLAGLVESMHHAGYVIGDLNESNVLVAKSGHITLIDTDSCQVRALQDGKVTTHRAPVGKPDYTAPEAQGVDFETVDRMFEHDRFALAVLLFLLLMEGQHPYSVKWSGAGDPPTIPKAIQQGLYSYSRPSPVVAPPPHAPDIAALETGVSDLFERSFGLTTASFHNRPSGQEWALALDAAITDNQARPIQSKQVASLAATSTPPRTPRRTRGVAPPPFDTQLAATSHSSQRSPAPGTPTPVPPMAPVQPPAVSVPPPPSLAPAPPPSARSRRPPWLWVIGGIIVLVVALTVRGQAQPVPRRMPTATARITTPTRTPLPATTAAGAAPTLTRPTSTAQAEAPTVTGGAVRVTVSAPLIDDDFSTSDSEDVQDAPDYKAYVDNGVMNLEVLAPGSTVWQLYPDVVVSEDFSFTISVENYRGQGEILAYIVEPTVDRTWAFAIDPVAKTWALDRDSDYGKGLFYWITPRKWEDAPDSFRTVTVQRNDTSIAVLVDGVSISSPDQAPFPEFEDHLQFGFGATINPRNRFGSGEHFAVGIDRVTLTEPHPG